MRAKYTIYVPAPTPGRNLSAIVPSAPSQNLPIHPQQTSSLEIDTTALRCEMPPSQYGGPRIQAAALMSQCKTVADAV
jgi:hypothetical protein